MARQPGIHRHGTCGGPRPEDIRPGRGVWIAGRPAGRANSRSVTGRIPAAAAVDTLSEFLRLVHSQLFTLAQDMRSAVDMVSARRHLVDAIPLAGGALFTHVGVFDGHVREI